MSKYQRLNEPHEVHVLIYDEKVTYDDGVLCLGHKLADFKFMDEVAVKKPVAEIRLDQSTLPELTKRVVDCLGVTHYYGKPYELPENMQRWLFVVAKADVSKEGFTWKTCFWHCNVSDLCDLDRGLGRPETYWYPDRAEA